MIFKRRIMQIGGSIGLTLPPDILEYLKLKVDDNITIEEVAGTLIIRKEKGDAHENTQPTK